MILYAVDFFRSRDNERVAGTLSYGNSPEEAAERATHLLPLLDGEYLQVSDFNGDTILQVDREKPGPGVKVTWYRCEKALGEVVYLPSLCALSA